MIMESDTERILNITIFIRKGFSMAVQNRKALKRGGGGYYMDGNTEYALTTHF